MSYILKAGKDTDWREHLLTNLMIDLIRHERLELVFERSKLLQQEIEKFFAKVKKQFDQNQVLPEWLVKRIVSQLGNKKIVDGVYLPTRVLEITKKFSPEKKSGFTSIKKLPKLQKGDGALKAEIKFCFAEKEKTRK